MEKNFDKIISAIGDNNTYQKRLALVVFFFWMTADFLAISIPYLEVNRKVQLFDYSEKRLYNYTLNYTICEKEKFFKEKTIEKSGHSWTIEFDIECDRSLVGLIGSFVFTGVLFGSFSFQIIPDLIGRKTTIIFSTAIFIVTLISFCIINNLKFLYANLIINQMFANICLLTTFMMTLEIVSIQNRSFYGAIVNSAFSFCGILFILLYKYLDNWRECFYLAAGLNFTVMLIFSTIAIESPRYFLYKNDFVKVYQSLMSIAKINKKENRLKNFLENPENSDFNQLKNISLCGEEENNTTNGKTCKNKTNDSFIQLTDKQGKQKLIPLDEEKNLIGENQEKIEKQNIEIEMNLKNSDNTKNEYLTINENKEENNSKGLKNIEKNKTDSFFDLLIYKKLRLRFLIACFLWFSTSGIYYGLSINIKNLPGDIYTNGIFIYFAEIFSYIISGYIIETSLGRIYSMILFESISFIGYMIIYLFKIRSYWQTIISFIARFAISAIYNIIYTYSVEIYPTTLRAKGFGTNSLCARFGGILFPMLIEFFAEGVELFFLSLNIISIILISFLPETQGKTLKDEVDHKEDS